MLGPIDRMDDIAFDDLLEADVDMCGAGANEKAEDEGGTSAMADEAPDNLGFICSYDPSLVVPVRLQTGALNGRFRLNFDEHPKWKSVFQFSDPKALKRAYVGLMNSRALDYTWGSWMDVTIPGSPVLALLVKPAGQKYAVAGRHQLRLLQTVLETVMAEKIERVRRATLAKTQWQVTDTLEKVKEKVDALEKERKRLVLMATTFWCNVSFPLLETPMAAAITAQGTLPSVYSAEAVAVLVSHWEMLSYQFCVLRCHVTERSILAFLSISNDIDMFLTPALVKEECEAYLVQYDHEKREKHLKNIKASMWDNLQHLCRVCAARGLTPEESIVPPDENETFRQMVLKCIRYGRMEMLRYNARKATGA